uniref:Uncharacterized protein n=1 Tax=Rhizophora mucronata TaxID=61149 RepID=A0A2P2NMV0_RHIMU
MYTEADKHMPTIKEKKDHTKKGMPEESCSPRAVLVLCLNAI